jgi:hypothetical protein
MSSDRDASLTDPYLSRFLSTLSFARNVPGDGGQFSAKKCPFASGGPAPPQAGHNGVGGS